jgi:hypothetical protein
MSANGTLADLRKHIARFDTFNSVSTPKTAPSRKNSIALRKVSTRVSPAAKAPESRLNEVFDAGHYVAKWDSRRL